jgi:hypothetical protein
MISLPVVEPHAVVQDKPLWTVALSVANTIVSWGTGALIFYLIHQWAAAAYLVLCAGVLVMSTYFRCRFCVYYGKRCTSGLGLISRMLFRKGDPAGFCDPKNIFPVAIPSFGMLLLPLAAGVAWAFLHFSPAIVLLTGFYFTVAMIGGYFFQRNVTCKDCAQGRAGCPSYRMMQGGKLE